MTAVADVGFILRVLGLFASHDIAGDHPLWWRTDSSYAPVTFLVICNDVFYWASGDAEPITPSNIALLESTLAEVAVLERECPDRVNGPSIFDAVDLFCARVRGMRPQGAAYRGYHATLWPLFDACGPERPATEPGNTPRPAAASTPTAEQT